MIHPEYYETLKDDGTVASSDASKLSSVQGKNLLWLRRINVRLLSSTLGREIIYGEDRDADGNYRDELNIVIEGYKKIATGADYGVVAISNLSYQDIVRIVDGEFDNIEIWAGYRYGGFYKFYEGSVTFISQKISSHRDYTCYITFANKLIAAWTQQRVNFNLNSGINLYTAFQHINEKCGVQPVNLDADLKKTILNKMEHGFASAKGFTDMVSEMDNSIFATTDPSAFGDVVDITKIDGKQFIYLDSDSIVIQNGNPTLDKNGLKITIMPTYNFRVGDVIVVDNRLIDISESSVSENKTEFKSMYLDTTFSKASGEKRNYGTYMIREIHFRFENRGAAFNLGIIAKALSLVSNWYYE